MRGDNLKKHMKKHDGKTEDNIVTKGLHDGKTEDKVVTNGQQISYTHEKCIAVQKRVFAELEEFNRKMELERYIKLVVDEYGFNEK